MSLKILVIDENFVSFVLNDYKSSKIISKTNTPVLIYTLDNNIKIIIEKTITDKSLRGRSFNILYCSHESYINNYQYIVEYKSHVNNSLRVIIL